MARGENYVLRKLIEDLQSIQRECDPGAVQAAQEQGKDKMDAFEAHKRDLTFMIVELKKADIKDLDQSHNQVRPNRGGNRDVAKNLKESRLREKEEDIKQGKESKEPIPMRELTAEAHQFHMQKEEHDVKVDAQLDVIRTGVRDLHELAVDMNDELNVQAVVTQEINKQFDVLDKKFKTANQRMNTLLEQTGGTARWCALMIAFVILMALLAYIFQIIGK